jgi:hypothetical protein
VLYVWAEGWFCEGLAVSFRTVFISEASLFVHGATAVFKLYSLWIGLPPSHQYFPQGQQVPKPSSVSQMCVKVAWSSVSTVIQRQRGLLLATEGKVTHYFTLHCLNSLLLKLLSRSISDPTPLHNHLSWPAPVQMFWQGVPKLPEQ